MGFFDLMEGYRKSDALVSLDHLLPFEYIAEPRVFLTQLGQVSSVSQPAPRWESLIDNSL